MRDVKRFVYEKIWIDKKNVLHKNPGTENDEITPYLFRIIFISYSILSRDRVHY